MNITNVRPGAGRAILAFFDLELEPGIRIYGLNLRRNAAGALRVFAPSADDKRVVTFAPELSDRISEMAYAAAEEHMLHGTFKAA